MIVFFFFCTHLQAHHDQVRNQQHPRACGPQSEPTDGVRQPYMSTGLLNDPHPSYGFICALMTYLHCYCPYKPKHTHTLNYTLGISYEDCVEQADIKAEEKIHVIA